MNYDYMHANWGGKICYVMFMDNSYFQKAQITNINALGVSAYEFKIEIEIEKKEKLPLYSLPTPPRRFFTNVLSSEICFYPWSAIRKIERAPDNE